MTLPEVARYLEVSPPRLVRAYCNRGTLDGIPLPEPLENTPFWQRCWLREEVRQSGKGYSVCGITPNVQNAPEE